jgi:hypothetical protein
MSVSTSGTGRRHQSDSGQYIRPPPTTSTVVLCVCGIRRPSIQPSHADGALDHMHTSERFLIRFDFNTAKASASTSGTGRRHQSDSGQYIRPPPTTSTVVLCVCGIRRPSIQPSHADGALDHMHTSERFLIRFDFNTAKASAFFFFLSLSRQPSRGC